MQIMNTNVVNVNRQNAKRCENAVKLLKSVMMYITEFARVAETIQMQSQTDSLMSHRLRRLIENIAEICSLYDAMLPISRSEEYR